MEMDNKNSESIISQIEKVLIEKNKRYGNAALSPINVFYKGDATNSICIRLDDKISRIKNSPELRKNDLFDLLGYLYLYRISKDTSEINKSMTFEEQVKFVSYGIGVFRRNLLKPNDKPIDKIVFEQDFKVISELSSNTSFQESNTVVTILMCDVITYFEENNILDFSDLLD